MGSGRKKKGLTKQKHDALKKTNDEFLARTGKTIGDAGRDSRAVNTRKRQDYPALERCFDGVARSRRVVIAQLAEEVGARRSAERQAQEQKSSADDQERLRLETAEELAAEHEQRLCAEAETRGAHVALAAEKGRRLFVLGLWP